MDGKRNRPKIKNRSKSTKYGRKMTGSEGDTLSPMNYFLKEKLLR